MAVVACGRGDETELIRFLIIYSHFAIIKYFFLFIYEFASERHMTESLFCSPWSLQRITRMPLWTLPMIIVPVCLGGLDTKCLIKIPIFTFSLTLKEVHIEHHYVSRKNYWRKYLGRPPFLFQAESGKPLRS